MTAAAKRARSKESAPDVDSSSAPAESAAPYPRVVHELLVRLSGRAPDELIEIGQELAAADDRTGFCATLAHACLVARLPLTPVEIDLCASVLIDADVDPLALAYADLVDTEPDLLFEFGATSTVGSEPPNSEPTELDAIAIDSVRGIEGARGLWRAHRQTALATRWPAPRLIYLIELATDEPAAVTVRLRAELRSAAARLTGDESAGPGPEIIDVLVLTQESELGEYAQNARAAGALLWAREEADPPVVLEVFDELDPESGPSFAADHPLIDDAERTALADYLDAGAVVLSTDMRLDDVITGASEAVGMDFRTDGRFVWTDTTTFYLREHGLAPAVELCDYARAQSFAPPEVDGVAIYRALGALQTAPEYDTIARVWGAATADLMVSPSADEPPDRDEAAERDEADGAVSAGLAE